MGIFLKSAVIWENRLWCLRASLRLHDLLQLLGLPAKLFGWGEAFPHLHEERRYLVATQKSSCSPFQPVQNTCLHCSCVDRNQRLENLHLMSKGIERPKNSYETASLWGNNRSEYNMWVLLLVVLRGTIKTIQLHAHDFWFCYFNIKDDLCLNRILRIISLNLSKQFWTHMLRCWCTFFWRRRKPDKLLPFRAYVAGPGCRVDIWIFLPGLILWLCSHGVRRKAGVAMATPVDGETELWERWAEGRAATTRGNDSLFLSAVLAAANSTSFFPSLWRSFFFLFFLFPGHFFPCADLCSPPNLTSLQEQEGKCQNREPH